MKVYVMIVDTSKNGISQNGMIEESISKGFEIANALGHFGININSVTWTHEEDWEHEIIKCGYVEGTSKVVNAVCVI